MAVVFSKKACALEGDKTRKKRKDKVTRLETEEQNRTDQNKTEQKRKEKKRKDRTLGDQFNEKPSITPACPGPGPA